MNETERKIPRRVAQTVLSSLKGGVVPRVGLPYIAVGRKDEIAALLSDVDVIADGGAAFRFIVGRYGAGKSFLLQTIRNFVLEKGFIVADADLSPERRLYGTHGQGLATYRELVGNLATKTKPEGGALSLLLDRWISAAMQRAAERTGLAAADPAFAAEVDREILSVTSQLSELVHGFEFSRLLSLYYHAYLTGDDEVRSNVLRWFRAEYETKRDAREALGVGVIITDDDWYDYLKLFALFFRLAGYAGLLVVIDELVNLYKIPNAVTRQYNYEKLLTMYNDVLQGKARCFGVLMGATPQALEDKRRGVYSYEALRSRLAEGRFSRPGARDLLAPVIRLDPLTPEEMLVLCGKLTEMHGTLYGYAPALSDADLALFLKLELERVGAEVNVTPREVIRDFIELLDLLFQHPDRSVGDLLGSEDFSFAVGETPGEAPDEAFAEFTV